MHLTENTKSRKMNNTIKKAGLWMIIIVCSIWNITETKAQFTWKLDANTSNTMDAAFFLAPYGSGAFISGGTMTYVPVSGGENSFGELKGIKNWPAGWERLTAALDYDHQTALLFSGNSYLTLEMKTMNIVGGGQWTGMPATWNNQVDAATKWTDTDIMFFYGTEYHLSNASTMATVQSGSLRDWPGWPSHWSKGMTAVMNDGNGFIYFFNGMEYVVYNQNTMQFSAVSKTATGGGLSGGIPAPAGSNNGIVSNSNTGNGASSNTGNSGCALGIPQGSKGDGQVIVRKRTKIGGKNMGTKKGNQVPRNSTLSEIRIWGTWMISGIQTVIVTKNGETKELPVLGRKTGKANVYTFANGECLTGLSGTYFGGQGDFIYSLQILTTNGTSEVFGKKGAKSFQIEIPEGTGFNGIFTTSQEYLKGIALKYVKYGNPEENVASNNGGGKKNGQGKGKSLYKDDFKDFIKDFTVNSSFGMTEGLKPLPGLDWYGRSIDVLKLDFMEITASELPPKTVIQVVNSDNRAGTKQNMVKPHGSIFSTKSRGSDSMNKEWVESYADVTSNFSVNVNASVGVAKLGGGSLSASYSEMNNNKVGSKSVYFFEKVERTIQSLTMEMTWYGDSMDDRYRQKLDFGFREKVGNLPVPNSDVQAIRVESLRKNKPLPSSIQQYKDAYMEIIKLYGTHFITDVAYGGKFIKRYEFDQKTYENTRATKFDFQAQMKAKIKVVDVGAGGGFSTAEKVTIGGAAGTINSKVYSTGASGVTNKAAWSAALATDMGPVDVTITLHSDLLNDIFFPGDKNIEKKRKILEAITFQYIIDNAKKPVKSRGGFYNVTHKALEYVYEVQVENIMPIDTEGSGEELFGSISVDFTGDKYLASNIWHVGERSARNITKNSPLIISTDPNVFDLDENASGSFVVEGTLHEEDEDIKVFGEVIDDDDPMGTKKRSVNLSEIKEVDRPYKYKVTGFRTGKTVAEINFTITKRAK